MCVDRLVEPERATKDLRQLFPQLTTVRLLGKQAIEHLDRLVYAALQLEARAERQACPGKALIDCEGLAEDTFRFD